MSSWKSYPKIYNLGHAAIADLFQDEVIIEEKVDGSQFSFGKFNGELKCKSKSKELILDAPEKMFIEAVETVKRLESQLVDGWTYRCEYLQSKSHNVLAYDRIPQQHLIIFDVNTGDEVYLDYGQKAAIAQGLGLEVVPLLFKGKIENSEDLLKLLELESILGGQKIEGIVIKNYQRFGRDGKVLMGKHVSERFKEIHGETWKTNNPQQNDILTKIVEKYKTTARWDKALIHLKENGQATNTPKDIGSLIKEVQNDIKEECSEEIKDLLFDWAWSNIQRRLIGGLPEWYKEVLIKEQFKNEKM